MRKVVVNSTPLISLSSIGMLGLLKDLYNKVYIPFGVYEEICVEGTSRIGSESISGSDFILI